MLQSETQPLIQLTSHISHMSIILLGLIALSIQTKPRLNMTIEFHFNKIAQITGEMMYLLHLKKRLNL
jgi:hypothetical protein